MNESKKKLSLYAFVLMILTSVFGVTNIGIGFYKMGYTAIPMFIVGALIYFIPYVMMVVEMATGFEDEEGGIYTWMKESVSAKFAFIGIMMWYTSYVIWMFGKSMSMWSPISFALFGEDITVKQLMVNVPEWIPFMGNQVDFGPFVLGILGVLLMLFIVWVISRGVSKLAVISTIGGISVIALNFILIIGGLIAFAVNGFQLQESLDVAGLLYHSPNPDYQSAVPFLGYLVMAIFAYGGTEAIAGVASDLENPQRDLKKGIFLAAGFIVVCYVVGFLMVGAAMQWADFPEGVASLTALYLIMQNLGEAIAGPMLGQFLMRFAGLGMFLSYLGAMIALCYAPLRQLIEGTPKEFWPESFQEVNENGIRVSAIKVQSYIVIGLLVLKSVLSLFNPDGAVALYELIINMTNVGMTIPYVFIIYAWFRYRHNDALPKNIILVKKEATVKILFILATVAVVFGNTFLILTPFLDAINATTTEAMLSSLQVGIWTVGGPIIFSIAAIVIYNRGSHKIEE